MKTDIGQHIDLKSNEIDKFTPPSHSDKTGEAVTSSTSESLNFYLIRLVRQLLDMAVANTDLSPVDKETLEKLLRYDSVAAIARQKHMTPEAVRLRVVKCMSALTDIINAWQEPSQKISSLQQRIKELEEIVNPQKQLLQIQVEKIRQLELQNERLKHLLTLQEIGDKAQDKQYHEVDATMKTKLSRTLENAAFPPPLAAKLHAHNIYYISELVRFTESKVSRLDGITIADVNKIIRQLSQMDLRLGMDVKWKESIKDFLIRE